MPSAGQSGRRVRVGGVSAARFVVGVAALVASCGALLLAARVHAFIAVVAAVAYTVALSSLGEWLVHGVLYHGRVPGLAFIRAIHHNGHHFALFPPTRYVQSGAYEFMRVRRPRPFAMSATA